MPTRAFLFCADQKALDAITQTLSELDVSSEIIADTATGLKQIAAQHFDLILADCDNGQSAAELFAAAKSSALNQGSMAIGIAEGAAGVVNAFRVGASLVLSKPVSMEQARGTLRNALAVLRKTAPETKASIAPAPQPQTSSEIAKTQNAPPTIAKAAPPIAPTQPVMKNATAHSITSTAMPTSPAPVAAKQDIQKSISNSNDKQIAKPARSISPPGEEGLGGKPPAPPTFGMSEKQSSERRTSPFLFATVALALIATGVYGYSTINPKFHGMLFAQLEHLEVMARLAPKPQPVVVVQKPAPVAPAPAPAPPVEAAAPVVPDGFAEPQPAPAQESTSSEPSKAAAPAIVNTSATTSNSAESEPTVVPEDVADNHVTYRVSPVYPEAARRKKIKGSVVLNAAIDKDGNVAALEVVTGNAALASAAVAAVKQWRYQVYYHNGQPSEFQTQVTVQFPQTTQR